MKTNVGTLDRIVRLVLGVALIAAALFSGLAFFDGSVVKYSAVAVGLMLTVTGLMSMCPVYSILGIRTCKI